MPHQEIQIRGGFVFHVGITSALLREVRQRGFSRLFIPDRNITGARKLIQELNLSEPLEVVGVGNITADSLSPALVQRSAS